MCEFIINDGVSVCVFIITDGVYVAPGCGGGEEDQVSSCFAGGDTDEEAGDQTEAL